MDAHRRWDETVRSLSLRLDGRNFELVPLSLDGTDAALEANELHFLLTNPGHFQSLMLQHELAPLVSLETDGPNRIETGNRYGAVIFARASEDSPKRLGDLRGKRLGAVSPEAFGGWQLALHTLRKNGLDPETDLKEVRFFGFPQRAIVRAVLNGDIDAGTVRTGLLEDMIEAGEVPADALTVLNLIVVPGFDLALSTALVPEWLIAATPAAPPDLRRQVAQILLEIGPSATGEGARWLPPQSLASVIEIQRTLSPLGAGAGLPTQKSFVLTGLVMIGLSAALATAALLYFRHQVGIWPSLGPTSEDSADDGRTAAPSAPLTAREAEVLDLVEHGQTTKEIARRLSISPKTVEYHRHNLMQKFGASNMAELVHRSSLWRYAHPPD